MRSRAAARGQLHICAHVLECAVFSQIRGVAIARRECGAVEMVKSAAASAGAGKVWNAIAGRVSLARERSLQLLWGQLSLYRSSICDERVTQ